MTPGERADDTEDGHSLIFPRGRRSAFVARIVRDKIVSGEIPQGTRINERILTEELGISRTPLREAFKILEGEGLVSIRPNAGATVQVMSPGDVEHCLELLIGLESFSAEHAAARVTDAEIAEIEALHNQMVAAFEARSLMEYFHLNQTIHQKIIDTAKNPAMSRVYAIESARIVRFRFAGNRDHTRWRQAVQEHEQILEALRRREGPLLRELVRMHLRAGWKVARKALEAEQTPGAADG